MNARNYAQLMPSLLILCYLSVDLSSRSPKLYTKVSQRFPQAKNLMRMSKNKLLWNIQKFKIKTLVKLVIKLSIRLA